jgi:hypothetical protein
MRNEPVPAIRGVDVPVLVYTINRIARLATRLAYGRGGL